MLLVSENCVPPIQLFRIHKVSNAFLNLFGCLKIDCVLGREPEASHFRFQPGLLGSDKLSRERVRRDGRGTFVRKPVQA